MEKNELKSYDELNQPETHSTEVLLSTIEELERTKKQLEIAVEALKYYGNEDKWSNCDSNWDDCDTLSCLCNYGYKFAQEALIKIKEVEK